MLMERVRRIIYKVVKHHELQKFSSAKENCSCLFCHWFGDDCVCFFFLLQELNKVESEVINFTDSTVPSVLSVEDVYYEMNAYRRNQYAALTYQEKDLPTLLSTLSKQKNTNSI